MSRRVSKNKRTRQMNTNACEQKKMKVTSRLETIGKLIINKLKGSKRNYLKKRLSTIAVTQNHSLGKRSLEEILNDFHTWNSHQQREYRTIGIGDEIINSDTSDVAADVENSLKIKEKKMRKVSSIPTRTICTRSLKLKSLNEDHPQKTDATINKQSSFSKPAGEKVTAIKMSSTKKFRLFIPCSNPNTNL